MLEHVRKCEQSMLETKANNKRICVGDEMRKKRPVLEEKYEGDRSMLEIKHETQAIGLGN